MPDPRRSIVVSSGRAHGFESIFAAAGNLHLQPIEPVHPSLISLVSARRSEELVRCEVAKASSGQRLSSTQFYPAAAITLVCLSEPLPPRRRRKNALCLLGPKLG